MGESSHLLTKSPDNKAGLMTQTSGLPDSWELLIRRGNILRILFYYHQSHYIRISYLQVTHPRDW